VFRVADVSTNPLLNKQGKGNWYCLDLQAQLQFIVMAIEQTKGSWFTCFELLSTWHLKSINFVDLALKTVICVDVFLAAKTRSN